MYAEVPDVLARAGKASGAWEPEGAKPGLSDLALFLGQTAAVLDAKIASHGFTVPVTGEAAAALTGLNADMAILLALPGTYVKDSTAIEELKKDVQRRVDAAMAALESGKHEVLKLLAQASTAADATSLWSPNSPAGPGTAFGDPIYENPITARLKARPAIHRGDVF